MKHSFLKVKPLTNQTSTFWVESKEIEGFLSNVDCLPIKSNMTVTFNDSILIAQNNFYYVFKKQDNNSEHRLAQLLFKPKKNIMDNLCG
jgi:hypothetical protein